MKVVKNVLISVDIEDIKSGVLVIPKNATSIADGCLRYLGTLEKVIGKSVTAIGNYNFYECNALTSVEFPLVTAIGNYNFRVCNALTSVEFPLVTAIGNYNFRVCNALTKIALQKSEYATKNFDGYLYVVENCKTNAYGVEKFKQLVTFK